MAGKLTQAEMQGGGQMTPKLAQAAAQAGAPPPGASAAPQQEQAGPAPGAGAPPPQAGPAPGAGAPPPQAAPQGAPAPAPGGQGIRQVDPTAAAVEGHTPAGMTEEQATPEEQAEYERAMKALASVLYRNDRTANAIVDQILPDDKISTTTKASILLIQQLDEKINMDEAVVAQMSQEVTARLMELAENRHGMQYGDREAQVIMGSVWEGVQELFGMEKQDAEALMAGIGGEGLVDLKGQYEAMLNG